MSEAEEAKRTVLFERHRQLGARMAPFGGYSMPIQYTGILAEHRAARAAAAVFDTCHMGEFRVSGDTALGDLENLVSCDLAGLAPGRCRYGLLCNPEGGVLDDLLVYRLDESDFMLVVNAGTQDSDYAWIAEHASEGTALRNVSRTTAKVDIQGPLAPGIVQSLVAAPIGGLKYYTFQHNTFMGHTVLVSRTGYTGEVGFEIYLDSSLAGEFWDACIGRGAVPAGLGARDTLRLEMGMPLYGHELTRERSAAAAGSAPFISKTKDFIGSEAIRNSPAPEERLAGITLEGRQAAREGDRILSPEGTDIGTVTSGSFAPSLGHAVALGYVHTEFAQEGTRITIAGRRDLSGIVLKPPFFREGSARKPMSDFL
ncbi:MAG: glycine cleavage system aminomethyltransferase GcvT [Acidobacteria bacterium]|nr:glycine cleavage system aminomethyltransferase GcvT [Acidobacteriota bacterium]